MLVGHDDNGRRWRQTFQIDVEQEDLADAFMQSFPNILKNVEREH